MNVDIDKMRLPVYFLIVNYRTDLSKKQIEQRLNSLKKQIQLFITILLKTIKN